MSFERAVVAMTQPSTGLTSFLTNTPLVVSNSLKCLSKQMPRLEDDEPLYLAGQANTIKPAVMASENSFIIAKSSWDAHRKQMEKLPGRDCTDDDRLFRGPDLSQSESLLTEQVA
ncbi:hypothetical protein llap_7033 [Limosa lapponica baueri]|uniref:Uncharacterized protein n=1 Tax=Limosa lapponica baueri TaxID=1758121 RepID=A0A2I0U9D1_LIMLA|nr:hypothetical protein llap_7033 [Limosa lapponica baueri]